MDVKTLNLNTIPTLECLSKKSSYIRVLKQSSLLDLFATLLNGCKVFEYLMLLGRVRTLVSFTFKNR